MKPRTLVGLSLGIPGGLGGGFKVVVEMLGQDFLEGKCLQMPGNDRIWMNMGYYGVIWGKMMPGLHRPHGKPLKSFKESWHWKWDCCI